MQIIGGQQYDPSQGDNAFSTGPASAGGKIILHNISPYDLILTFNDDPSRQAILHAWQPRIFDFCGKKTLDVCYTAAYQPTADVIANAPKPMFIWGEAYAKGEKTPESLPNYDRLSNVGNTVTTQGGSANVKNDGNTPGTQVIETTPSDQTQSAIIINNDGSALWQILSANVLRTVLSIIRGNNGATKAQVQFGDAGDTSIATLYATMGAGSIIPEGVPWANINQDHVGTNPFEIRLSTPSAAGIGYTISWRMWDGSAWHTATVADQHGNSYATFATNLLAYDSTDSSSPPPSLTQLNNWNPFIGLTDPTSVAGAPTPNEGDAWIQDPQAGSLTNHTRGPTNAPSGGWDAASSTCNQMWVSYTPSSTEYLTNIAFYLSGEGSNAPTVYTCIWDNSGNLLGYGGPGNPTGGSESIGGQAWHNYAIVNAGGSSASSVTMNAGTTYKIGIHRQTLLSDWSLIGSSAPSPFGGFGYNTQSSAPPAVLGSSATPTVNFCPGIYLQTQTGTQGQPGHLYLWRSGGWEQIV